MGRRIKLLESQRELIRVKRFFFQEAIRMVEQRKAELQGVINLIAKEQGIDIENEVWKLDENDEFFEKVEGGEKCQ